MVGTGTLIHLVAVRYTITLLQQTSRPHIITVTSFQVISSTHHHWIMVARRDAAPGRSYPP